MFSNFFQKNLFVVFFKLWRIIWKVRKLFKKFLGWRYQRSTFCDVILFNHFLRWLHEFRTAEIVENLQWRRSFYFFWSHKFFSENEKMYIDCITSFAGKKWNQRRGEERCVRWNLNLLTINKLIWLAELSLKINLGKLNTALGAKQTDC